MKLSKRIGIYISGLLILFALVVTSREMFRPFFIGVWIIWDITGAVYALFWVKKLEKGIELLPDMEAFQTLFADEREKTARLLAEGILEQQDAIKDRYSVKVMDRQSQIDSLQSQINPHFLYNTLECIRSEAVFCKCDSIANMAKSLASFFRYSISRKENIVTISDEMNNIKNYFSIQNYRFENKFEFHIDVEEDEEKVYSYLIPKMTLQPIVENSIFHGLETKTGDCLVKVHIYTTEEKVIIIVSDNGIGMDHAALESLRRRMEQGDAAAKDAAARGASAHGNGIALYNVNQRIRLAFGNEYGLQVYSTEGAGTSIEIIMPIAADRKVWD